MIALLHETAGSGSFPSFLLVKFGSFKTMFSLQQRRRTGLRNEDRQRETTCSYIGITVVHTYSFPRRCTGILLCVGLVAKNRWQVQRREFLFFRKSDSNKGGCSQLLQILSCSLVVSTHDRFQDRRENGKTARRGNFHKSHKSLKLSTSTWELTSTTRFPDNNMSTKFTRPELEE